jgi:hypothetical protein
VRKPNAIDFWRGIALIVIFVNHIPGNAFEALTYSRYTISDAAELFVFLAGWSLALATHPRAGPEPPLRVLLRLGSRTVEVYRAQLVIVLLALAMIAGAALYLDNPLILEWHHAGPFFGDPIQTTIGLVLLTHQLGFFNILPLYVVLLILAPIFVLLARVNRWAAFGASFALYVACLSLEINLPSWPVEGRWFFNPLAWQFLLVLGFLSALWAHESATFRTLARCAMPLGLVGVAVGVMVSVSGIRPDPFQVPEPRLFFLLDKSYVSPGRLADFIAVVLAFQSAYSFLTRASWLTHPMAALGRNSLAVFSMGSVLALAAQLIRAALPPSFFLDLVLISSGVFFLLLTAWFVEWRYRSRSGSLED